MITQATANAILAAAIATGKVFDPAATFLRLFTAGPTGLGVAGSEFTFASAAAYNAEAITTWGSVQHLEDGRPAVASPAITFTPGSGADAATFIGWCLGNDSVTTTVKEWNLFPEPQVLSGADKPLTLIVRLALPFGTANSYDATVVIDG